MRISAVAVSVFLSLSALGGPFEGHKVARVRIQNDKELALLESLGLEIWSCGRGIGQIDVQVTPRQLAELERTGLPFSIWIEDVDSLVSRQYVAARGADYHASYHPLAEIESRLQEYVTNHPGLASMFDFGTSVEGRTLWGIRFTGPGDGADKPAIFFHGGQHAREWVSPAITVYIAEWLLTNYGVDPTATRLVDDLEWFILPVMNPDGYEFTWIPENRLWRKNRRNNGDGTFGVDLNRNWGWGWGGEGSSGSTSSDIYRGPEPFSEPETDAMRDFILAHSNIVGFIDFHSYSQLVLWPWGDVPDLPPDNDEFEYVGSEMAQRILAVHGYNYVYGPIYTTIYPAAGASADWVYGANLPDQFIAAFAFELRDTGQYGFLLPPEQIVPTAEENLEAVLFLAQAISEPVRVELVSALPSSVVPGETLTVRVAVTPRREGVVSDGVGLWFRTAAQPFSEVLMAPAGGDEFEGVLPAVACDGVLQFYVLADGDEGGQAGYPADAPFETVAVPIGSSFVHFHDDLETVTGWTAGDAVDTATTGVWTRVNPNGTPAQPEDDFTPTPGVTCFVTGQGTPGGSLGENDVDGGKTTLFSPVFLVAVEDDIVSYARWYSNNQGAAPNADQMDIAVSPDAGANWTPVETVTENAGTWVVHSFRPADVGVPATDQMRLRFVASDFGQPSIVEAGIDELVVSSFGCTEPDGDANQDGTVTTADHATLASCLSGPDGATVSASCAVFNLDLDSDVDMDDYQTFVALFGIP